MITRIIAFARGLMRRRKIDEEIVEELQDHIEREIQMHRSNGVSLDDARRMALRDLGGLTQTIESTRNVRATWFDGLERDLHYAARVLRRSPRFTATALALLILGAGSATAILSITYAVLVRPLPYPDSDRLVFVTEKDGAGVAWPNFEGWRTRATSFEGLAGSLADAAIVTSGEVPRRFESRNVTSNFFRVLRTTALYGRLFDDADARPDAPPTVVVSHAFWMRELGGRTTAIGQQVSLGANPFQVIGVLPPGFRYMTPADIYRLIEPQVAANYRGMQSPTTRTNFYVVGRLKPRIDVPAARLEMQTVHTAMGLAAYGKPPKEWGVELVTLADRIVGKMATTLAVISGAVTLLLLITCVNLAGLLLTRSAARSDEFRIRAAIGGSRWHLVRQLLVEQGVLVAVGGVLGAAVGATILRGLIRLAPRDLPRLDEIHLDFTVMFAITALSCACAFVFGVVPVFKTLGGAGHGLVAHSGRGTTRSGSWLRSGLMIGEIALATVLLAGSGLMVRTMLQLAHTSPGFDPHNLQTVMFSLQGASWPDEKKQNFYPSIVERLRAVPGVENAAITYSLPILGSNWWNVFMTEGTTPEYWTSVGEFPNAGMVPVTAGYFEMLRIPLLRGRSFDLSDTPTSLPVAIVNSSAAKRYWPNGSPIGKQIRQGYPDSYGPWRTIVGVVGDIKQEGVDRETSRQVFFPVVQQPRTTVFAVARTRGPVPAASMEAAIHQLDRTIPVFNDRTIEQVMSEASSRRRIAMVVLSVFGGVALLLASIGLYGVVAQGVADRHKEIGVRMALGATSREIVRLFVRHGLIVIAVGIPVGVVAAVVAARSLASLVFGITVTDPPTLGAVVVVLVCIALLASYLPARAAARIDPLDALRAE